jgi:putative sterol carrier protein
MAYTTTTKELFETTVPQLVRNKDVDVAGPVLFEITGNDAGTWTVDFKNRSVTAGRVDGNLAVIVRAQEHDFMALVEGRMSPSDGIITGRLSLAGDAASIFHLMDAITPPPRA